MLPLLFTGLQPVPAGWAYGTLCGRPPLDDGAIRPVGFNPTFPAEQDAEIESAGSTVAPLLRTLRNPAVDLSILDRRRFTRYDRYDDSSDIYRRRFIPRNSGWLENNPMLRSVRPRRIERR